MLNVMWVLVYSQNLQKKIAINLAKYPGSPSYKIVSKLVWIHYEKDFKLA